MARVQIPAGAFLERSDKNRQRAFEPDNSQLERFITDLVDGDVESA